METAYMTTLLMLCSIVPFSRGEGNDRRKRYEAFPDGKNLTEAKSACRVHGLTNLAKISNGNELRLARNIPSVSSGMKYLTGLIYTEAKSWKWTDTGSPRRDAEFLGIVDSDRVDEVSHDLQVTYCFLLTNNTKLEITNCTERHGYICEGFKGAPTTATEQVRSTASATPIPSGTISLQRTPKPSGTITRQATSMSSDTIILHGIITSTTVTAKTTIVATKSLSTATHVSRTSPTDEVTPEKQIQLYVSRIRNLKFDDEESLQIAVNETSALLTRFHETPYPKTQENLLSVAQHLETFAAKHAVKHLNTIEKSATTIMKKSLVITVQEVTAGRSNDVIFPPDDNARIAPFDLKEKIYLPAKLFKSGDAVIVGIVYKFMHKLLPDESHAFLDKKRLKNTALRTQIISCSVFPSPPDELQENVTISFTLEKRAKSEDKPHCVFWDFEEQTRFNGSWSRKGCSLVNKTETQVTCTCNHLTNFAVLMQIGETKAPVEHQVALEIITYIGCSLSLLGEVLTVVAYSVLMNLWQEQCQIRLNLVVSIAFAQIIFLGGIDATTRHTACIFVAVSIHYFYLVGFAWMLVEGIYLYLMVVKVFNTMVKMKLFYAFSWGFPGVIVVISLVFASTTDAGVMSYIHSDFCWVSFSNNLVWTFAAPVLFVCLANSLILCRVVCEITSMQAAKNNSNFRQGLKACIVLFPLLGMTWVFGVLSVTDAGLAFQYIFTVFNSLQGFFIFVIHVLRNSDVKAAYLRKKQKLEASKDSNFQNLRFVADASADQSQRYGMCAIRESKASPDPHLRRHQVSPINSDTRASCLTPVDS